MANGSSRALSSIVRAPHGRMRSILFVCISILALVSMLHALGWRDARFAETFEVVPNVDMSVARHPKSQLYARTALIHYFSDGTDTSNEFLSDALFFAPSNNDVICRLGSASVTGACANERSRIDSVSCRDRTTLMRASSDCSRDTISTSKEPIDPRDCDLRIFEGHYHFAKNCITMGNTLVKSNMLHMPANQYTTKIMVLLRPAFITGPLSKLYAVTYDIKQNSGGNTMNDFDSDRKGSNLDVPLTLVTHSTITDPTDGIDMLESAKLMIGQRRVVMKGVSNVPMPPKQDERITLPTTLYYLNFMKNLDKPPTPYRVMTIYMYTPKSSNGAMPKFNAVPQLTVTMSPNSVVVQVQGGRIHTLPMLLNGMLVVTYTTNLLILSIFNQTRVVFRRVGNMPNLALTGDQFLTLNQMAAPPREMYPYTNSCIPNLADVAIKAGMLGNMPRLNNAEAAASQSLAGSLSPMLNVAVKSINAAGMQLLATPTSTMLAENMSKVQTITTMGQISAPLLSYTFKKLYGTFFLDGNRLFTIEWSFSDGTNSLNSLFSKSTTGVKYNFRIMNQSGAVTHLSDNSARLWKFSNGMGFSSLASRAMLSADDGIWGASITGTIDGNSPGPGLHQNAGWGIQNFDAGDGSTAGLFQGTTKLSKGNATVFIYA
jgi:hypothetical protein